jgi:hypothetical protein
MPKLITRVVTILFMSLMIILPVFSLACGYQDIPTSQDTVSQENNLLQFTAGGHVLGFGNNAVYLAGMDHALKVEFAGGNTVQPVAANAGKTETASLDKVCYHNVWDNIDITYSAINGGIAESTYVIYPEGNPADISLQYNVPVDIAPEGSLCFNFETGYMTESAPFAWQEINGEQLLVDVSFQRQTNDRIGFNLSDYNGDYAVYIDPTYQWHTFYGAANADYGRGIAIDASGNIYVTGDSRSTWNGPGDTPPLHAYNGTEGKYDIVVIKLNNAGTYQWHTFYGGSEDDYGSRIALDQSLNIYIAGYSHATWNGAGSEPPKHAYTGTADIVILKLNNPGAYQWHTFYGGGHYDQAEGIAIDQSAGVYVTGYSEDAWNGPAGQIPVNGHSAGENRDLVVIKVDTDGAYVWHTFHGSSGSTDYGQGIALDQSANIYIAGGSNFTWNGPGDTPPLHGHAGGSTYDFSVLKLNNTGTYQWHTFYGSADYDFVRDIALDQSANIYVTGESWLSWNGPGGENPLHAYTGGSDIAILSLTSNGAYRWHTFYGSTSSSGGYGIAVDATNNVYIAGYSAASWNGPGDIPPVVDHDSGANLDMVLIKLDGNGGYVRHTFYGSFADDKAYGVKVDTEANIYMTGYSCNTWNGPGNTLPLNAYTAWNDITVIKTGLEPVPIEEEEPPAAPPALPNPKPFLDDSGAVVMGSFADIGIGNVNVLQTQVASNSQAVIYANVVNKGDLVGSFTVTLKINGQVEETRSVAVNANSAVPVQFNVTRDEPGTYLVDINGKQTSFTVMGTDNSTTDSSRMAFIIGIGICSLAVVIALVTLILRRRTNS